MNTIRYPPNPILRKHLQNLYIDIMGALDVGDFETFLKESADLTYEDVKAKMIQIYGLPKSESKLFSAVKANIERFEVEAEEVSPEGYEKRIEELEKDLGAAEARRFEELEAARKRIVELEKELKLPPTPVEIKPEKKEPVSPDYIAIKNRIEVAGRDELELIKGDIEAGIFILTEREKEEILRMVGAKLRLLPIVPPIRVEIPEVPLEMVVPERRVVRPPILFKPLTMDMAGKLASKIRERSRDIIAIGLREWIIENPIIPPTTHNLTLLSIALISLLRREPKNMREWMALSWLERYGGIILAEGIEEAKEKTGFYLKELYDEAKKKVEMPDLDTTIREVQNTLLSF